MKKCNGSVMEVESSGMTDGPGIRTVVFLNGCSLRCKFCHNPEMQEAKPANSTPEKIVKQVLKNRPYFGKKGGVTFSGGEPLLQPFFLRETCKLLKNHNIHIALDTAGIGIGGYDEILQYIDLVLLDIKHIAHAGYIDITQRDRLNQFLEFKDALNKSKKPVWIRQVIVPGVHDNEEYVKNLAKFLKTNLKNVERVDFLPYHKLGSDKYQKLGRKNPYEDKPAMNPADCDKLYQKFLKFYK